MTIDKTEIKALIEKQISTLERKIKNLKELTTAIAPDDAIGRVSRMDAINNKSVNEAALRQSELKLNKLKETLGQINDKDFGLCLVCKAPIQPGRIILMPESRKCIRCAQR